MLHIRVQHKAAGARRAHRRLGLISGRAEKRGHAKKDGEEKKTEMLTSSPDAASHNDAGRAAFVSADFDGALAAYAAAIAAHEAAPGPRDIAWLAASATYHANRAAASLHLRNYVEGG
ncbi:MAG: hypothetical protein P4L96_17020 [Rhodoferax sp.]|nr:hypothetical protein [Rhodoferax sp.]